MPRCGTFIAAEEPGDAEEAFRVMLELLHCHNLGVSDSFQQVFAANGKVIDPLDTMCAPYCTSHDVFW